MKALAVRGYALREMLRLLRRRPGSFVLAVLLAAAAFTAPLAGTTVALALAPLAGELALGPEINLFLAPATPTTEIRQLQSSLAARAGVSRVEWVTRDAALKSLAQRSGSSAIGELKANPLPDVLVVSFASSVAPAELESATAALRKLPRVDAVGADTGWHRKLAALLETGTLVGLFIAGLSATLLVLIVLGAVQLQLATSRDDIRVLRLVGADDRFIVRPFAYAGGLTLAAGATLAALVTWLALAAAGAQIAELARLYGLSLAIVPLPPHWLLAIIATAALVGGTTAAIGARLALARTR